MRRCLLAVLLVLAAAIESGDARAQFCPGVSPWVFDDVLASDPFCGFITKMAQQGVTLGCIVIDANHRLYCPNDSVNRKQMAAFMARLGDALLPPTCNVGQVLKWNGATWACADDTSGGGGGGTVTSVLAGTGLQGSPNPITGSGSLNLAPSYQLPQTCTNGQIPASNGSGGWACASAGGGGTVTSVAAGTGLTGGIITGSGTIAADASYLQRRVSANCAVGSSIRAIAADGSVTCQAIPANAFVQGGNAFAAPGVLGTTDVQPLDLRVNGLRAMRLEPNSTSVNVVGGSASNAVNGGAAGVTIAGGRSNTAGGDYSFVGGGLSNDAQSDYATIGGGINNTASFGYATIGGGQFNEASGNLATIGGGISNVASGNGSFIGGGGNNTASGGSATIAGGGENVASGSYSFTAGLFNTAQGSRSVALGFRAKAQHDGTFVFADYSNFDFGTGGANTFRVRATGGVRFVVDIDGTGGSAWSCALVSGGSWACSSDRNQKQDFVQLDGLAVLDKVAAMPLYAWSPKGRNSHTRHYGPTAQDFHAAFGLGDSDLVISQQDADGVALAAIQGLNAKLERAIAERDAQIASQARELAEMRGMIEVLIARTTQSGVIAAR